MKFLSFIVVAFSASNCIGIAQSSPHGTQSRGGNLNFFWYPGDNGGHLPAFLEGGPRPKVDEKDVKFYLYTLMNPNTSVELFINNPGVLDSSVYIKGAKLKIITHGFGSSYKAGPGPILKSSYFRNQMNHNVILVDWSTLAAAPWYDTAAGATKLVGHRIGRFVSFLVNQHVVSLEDVHFIGHSLGAHVGGFMGSYLGSGLVGRITALDPALPLFGDVDDSGRIDSTDAAFVDVIHTAAGTLLEGGLAFKTPRGHADFYPNGGGNQPGCGIDPFGACSHRRCYEYMAESINKLELFSSCKCSSWENFNTGVCGCPEKAYMGEFVSSEDRGKFYLRTNAIPPWAEIAPSD